MNLFPIISVLILNIKHSYGLGFDYPLQMPSPHEIVVYNNVLYGYVTSSNAIETPIVVRIAHIGTVGAWNCVAQYDSNALDVITKKRPIVEELPANEFLTSYTRSLCLQYVYIKIMNIFYPPMVPYYVGLFTLWGLQNIEKDIDESVINCNHDKQCLTQLARDNRFYPSFMASIITNEIKEYFMNDGWNFNASLNSKGECTANCKSYADTTGYQPKISKNKNKSDSKSKSKCKNKDDDYNWVPLLESDGFGFFFKHQHVTPHIGITAKPFLLSQYKTAPKPNYDYDAEIELLLDRLKKLAVNDTMKMMVEFFDNKLIVRGMIGLAMLRQYPSKLTYENFINYIIGISLTEHDTLLTAWNQKIKYDLIRPTTIIQRKGKELITTYGGPYQGIKTFEAKDFEPYIRIMPHSEYPSGSACFCIGYMEFVLNFIKNEFDDDELYNLVWYKGAGSSSIEPNMTPNQDLIISINNMSHLYQICSESRLWGGMHFTKSIHSAKQICSGIGSMGYQYAVELKNNSNFIGSTFVTDADIDIQELWLPFLKGLDFLLQFSFGDLLEGNIDFDPQILKLLSLVIPNIGDLNAINSLFGLIDDIVIYLSHNLGDNLLLRRRLGANTIINGNKSIYLIIIAVSIIISILCVLIGIYIGIKYSSQTHRENRIEWK